MNKILKFICYFIYYGFAQYLPRTYELGPLGRFSSWLRWIVCRPLMASHERKFHIERRANFGGGGKIYLSYCASLGENLRIMGNGHVYVGKHVMIGPDVMIITSDHKILPEGFGGYIDRDVVIGDYAWICARVIILKGVKIGKWAVVGAGAVVTKDVPDYAVVGGQAAKIIYFRKKVTSEKSNLQTSTS